MNNKWKKQTKTDYQQPWTIPPVEVTSCGVPPLERCHIIPSEVVAAGKWPVVAGAAAGARLAAAFSATLAFIAVRAAAITVADIIRSVDEPLDATQCGGKENCLGEAGRCMTHELWSSLNTRMVEFLDSVTLQKLVDDQLAKGLQVEDKPSLKRAISALPVSQPIRINAPNSVFALGNAFSKG